MSNIKEDDLVEIHRVLIDSCDEIGTDLIKFNSFEFMEHIIENSILLEKTNDIQIDEEYFLSDSE